MRLTPPVPAPERIGFLLLPRFAMVAFFSAIEPLRIANRILTKIFDDALRPFGVKLTQMNVLVAIGNLAPVRPRELCRRLELDASTLSRNVERMVQQGWIRSEPDPDSRAQLLSLTDDGAGIVHDAYPAWQRAQADALERLGTAGAVALGRVASSLAGSD